MGGLGKLFSEINEEVDPRQLEAMEASGTGLIRKIRYGVIPQVLPNYASYALIRLEGNLAAPRPWASSAPAASASSCSGRSPTPSSTPIWRSCC
uniref:Uncharacterized protein n=1 Tax=Phenylobacterium glaciei TaxID=2803784 RepID=A0A974P5I2_9CAUL|nr:hypothetical protein JKL49_08065 [Phenylobacterium glaciei]